MFRCVGFLARLVNNDFTGHLGFYSKIIPLKSRLNLTNPASPGIPGVRFYDQANTSKKNRKKNTYNINDLLSHINSGNTFYLKQLKAVFHTIKFDTLRPEEAELLLTCCGSIIPDSSRKQRNSICQEIFSGLKQAENLSTGIINRYIKTCTENNSSVEYKDFLKSQPDTDTYKFLLENVSQFGKIQEVLAILEIMKTKEIPLENKMVNSLTMAYTIAGGLESARSVLGTMRLVQISDNYDAKLAVLKGLVKRKDLHEFKLAAVEYYVPLTEHDFLDFIEELGVNGIESWLHGMDKFYSHIPMTRDLQAKVEKICIHLVHMEQSIAAINIYKSFVEPQSDVVYGYAIFKEMLHCDINIKSIINEAKYFVERGLSPYILESLTELALKFKYEYQAWELLRSLDTLRPHYFWPLLVQAGYKRGELGVMSTLKNISEFNVRLNAETLEYYILPYCDLSNLKLLIIKLQNAGFTVKEIVSPLIAVLLQQKKTKRACDLCHYYNVNISGDTFLPLLAKAWTATKDSVSVVALLARYCESNRHEEDMAGIFLIKLMEHGLGDFQTFISLIQHIGKNRLRITPYSAEVIQEHCSSLEPTDAQRELDSALHSLVDLGLSLTEENVIPHPRKMDINGLESHLVQLQEKKMNTRGVLRRLIQMYAGKGNVQRVMELRELLLASGYEESAGMKSSIMHSYVVGNQLDEAMNLYDEVLTHHPEFRLDSFKFIDLVKLLVQNGRFEEGRRILESELSKCKKNVNPKSIERNCRELLSACQTAEAMESIFNLLIQSGICAVSNIILGPLVRIHIISGNIDRAVDQYVAFSKKYKCTPLQLEVLRQVTKQENGEQLEQVLKATENVHGTPAAHIGLIAALAENGQENALRKLLVSTKHPIQSLMQNRCNRWVEEQKIEPLICLAKAFNRLPRELFNIEFIYKCIFDVYDICGNYKEANSFFERMPEEFKSLHLQNHFNNIMEKNNGASGAKFAKNST